MKFKNIPSALTKENSLKAYIYVFLTVVGFKRLQVLLRSVFLN